MKLDEYLIKQMYVCFGKLVVEVQENTHFFIRVSTKTSRDKITANQMDPNVTKCQQNVNRILSCINT